MITRASVTDVFRNFSDYVSRVAYRGERFLLLRGGKPVAELGPAPAAGRRLADLPELMASLPTLGDGEAARFAADLEAAREMVGRTPELGPWGS